MRPVSLSKALLCVSFACLLTASSSAGLVPVPSAVAQVVGEALPEAGADIGFAGLNRDDAPVAEEFGAPGLPQWNDYPMAGTIQSHSSAAEPTIGIKWIEDAADPLFFKTQYGVGRAVWDDSVAGAKPSVEWSDVSVSAGPLNPETTWVVIDPILSVNEQTGRIFAGQMRFPTPCGNMWFSDDEGATWIPMQLACSPNGGDHQKVGSGPFSKDVPTPPQATALGVESAVYYCAQYPGIGGCGASHDGGLTFPYQTTVPCGSFQGSVVVSPEGYVAVPNRACGGGAGFSFSTNNGESWVARGIAGLQGGQMDPSVGFSRGLDENDKTLTYLAVAKPDGAYVAISDNFGVSWFDLGSPGGAKYVNVGQFHDPPVTGAEFINVQVGDADRAAVSFLGLTTGTPNQSTCPGAATQVWHMYVARTYDRGATWDVQQVSSHPVQIGSIFTGGLQVGVDSTCRNLLEFNDLAIDDQGRIHVGFADGCPGTGTCTTANRGAKATVIRQTTGLGLFEAHDEEVVASPEITITSPAQGATGVASDVTVQGLVDRAGSGTGPALTVDAAGPYSGAAQQAIPVTATVTGGAGGHACAWSGTGASFANADQCATTVTYASSTGSPFTIAVTATEAGHVGASDTATVTLAVAHGTLLGTDPADDTGTTCPAGGVPPCNGANVNGARPGLDLLAAYVRAEAGDVVFTFEVADASKFLVEPTGDPAEGAPTGGRILEYNLNVGYVAGPTSGEAPYGVAHDVAVSRLRGSPDLTATYDRKILTPEGSLSGGPLSLAAVPGTATIDTANDVLTVRFTTADNADHLEPLNDIKVTSSYVIQGSGSNHVVTVDDLDVPATSTWGSSSGLPSLPVPGASLARNSCSGTLPSASFPASPVCTLDVPTGASVVQLYYNTTYTGTWSAIVELFDPGAQSRGYSLEDCPQPPPGAMSTFSCVLTTTGPVDAGDWSAEIYYQLGEATEDYTLTLVARAPETLPLVVDANGPYAGTVGTPIAVTATASGGVAPRACAWSGTGAVFAAPGLCATTVTFDSPGSKLISVAASDAASASAADTATVSVTDGSTPVERVEVYEGATLLGSDAVTTSGDSSASWAIAVAGLSDGEHTLTAKWFDADVPSAGAPLATRNVSFSVEAADPCEGVTQGPVLDDLSWTATARSATIEWTSDVSSTSVVEYGVGDTDLLATGASGTTHTVELTGLSPGTEYTYVVSSTACETTSSPENTFMTATEGPSVTITDPSAGSEQAAPVQFAGAFDGSDTPRTTSGTGFASLAGSPAWGLELQKLMSSRSWGKASARLDDVPGFVAAHPIAENLAVAYVSGGTPADAPVWLNGWFIAYQSHARYTALSAPFDGASSSARHLSIEQALEEWQAMQAEPAGLPLPGDMQQGIGPGSALLQGNNGIQYICSASYVFQDPDDLAQYYLATAGHCLLSAQFGIDKTGAATPADVFNTVDVCFKDCFMNLGQDGTYVRLEAKAGYHPVAYASASPDASDANGIGRDAGFIRIPKELNPMLRPWMSQWGGPDAATDTTEGDLLGIYGHGVHACAVDLGCTSSRTPYDQGRLLVSAGSFPSGSFEGVGWTSGGDSGAAIGIVHDDEADGLRADEATGINTHGLTTPVGPSTIFTGTLLSKAVAMFAGHMDFTPVLVKSTDAIVLAGGGEGPTLGAAFTAPTHGASIDKTTTSTVTVSGTAAFPADGAGTGGSTTETYFLHRTSCGETTDATYMDTVAGPVDGGDGCGSILSPAGAVVRLIEATAGSFPLTDPALTDVFPADPAPAANLRFDTSRPVRVDIGVSGRESTPVILGEFRAQLAVDGVVVASGSTSGQSFERVAFDLAWTAQAASAPAGSDLVFTWMVDQGATGVYMAYGGPDGSKITIPTTAAATRAVEVRLEGGAACDAGTIIPVTGASTWAGSWALASVAPGPQTLCARALHDGQPVGVPALRAVTVTETVIEAHTVEVQVTKGAATVLAYTPTEETYSSPEAGTWAYGWAPASAEAGTYSVTARLMLGTEVKATSPSVTFVVPGDSTTSSSSTTTTASTTTTSSTTTTTAPPAPPTLSSLSRTFGSQAGGTQVTIFGSGFTADATVTFGDNTADDIVVVDATKITVDTPAGTAGETVDVTVTQTSGSDTLTNAFLYTGSSGSTSSTTSTSGSAGGSASNLEPIVDLDDLTGADNLRNDAPVLLQFTGVATDGNGCGQLTAIQAALLAPDYSETEQAVAFNDDCTPGEEARTFAGTIALPAGTPAGWYLLQVTATDDQTSNSTELVFTVRVPNVLEFSYNTGSALDFGSFAPGARNVPSQNWLIIENTDDLDREAFFDMDPFVGTGPNPDTIVLVDNMHVQVMESYVGGDFLMTRELDYVSTSLSLGDLAPGAKIAVRLVIDEVPRPLKNDTYTSSFGITEG